MRATVDPHHVLGLLETGRRTAAEDALRAVRGEGDAPDEGPPRRDDEDAWLTWTLGRVVEHLAGSPAPGAGSPANGAHGVRDPMSPTAAAARALELGLAAADALRSGRVGELVANTREAARLAPESMPWVRFFVASLQQACFRFTGDAALLAEATEACGRVADDVGRPYLAVQARGLLGSIHLLSGAYHAAMACCGAGLALAESEGLAESAAPAMAHQFRGYVLFEWNRLEEAEAALDRAWALAGEEGRGVRSGVARVRARLAAERGDRAGADEWLDRLDRIVREPMTLRNREWLTAVRVGHGRGIGDVRAIEAWLRTYDYRPATLEASSNEQLAARLHELEHLLAMLEETEQWGPVRAVASALLRGAGGERRWFAARALSADAVALEAQGRRDEADRRWAEGLEAGALGSFVRVYVEGSPLRFRLLDRAADGEPGERGGPAAEARRVLEASASAPVAADGNAVALTPRQLAVLERVARGDSNKTVARELGLSVSTVKTHLREAFARLGASSRTQAAALARERGWL